MPLTPTNSKLKIALVLVALFVVGSLVYFKVHDARAPSIINTEENGSFISAREGVMEDGVMEFENATTTDEVIAEGSYEVYSPDKVLNADTNTKIILFFNASWCSTCQRTDRELTISKIPEGLLILSVDYDSYITLRKTHEATEHTFVEVDSSGNVIQKWKGGGLDDIVKMSNLSADRQVPNF